MTARRGEYWLIEAFDERNDEWRVLVGSGKPTADLALRSLEAFRAAMGESSKRRYRVQRYVRAEDGS